MKHLVKCPRCKKKWEFRSGVIIVAPKYKYCDKCLQVVVSVGGIAGRGVFRGVRVSSQRSIPEE